MVVHTAILIQRHSRTGVAGARSAKTRVEWGVVVVYTARGSLPAADRVDMGASDHFIARCTDSIAKIAEISVSLAGFPGRPPCREYLTGQSSARILLLSQLNAGRTGLRSGRLSRDGHGTMSDRTLEPRDTARTKGL